MAQQAFSSDQGSTLHLAIPALETLHKSWDTRARKPKYARFSTALNAAATKLDKYYEKTTDSPAYIMAMCMFTSRFNFDLFSDAFTSVLDPTGKMSYFKKNWPEELQTEVRTCAEKVVCMVALICRHLLTTAQFKERYLSMQEKPSASEPVVTKGKTGGRKKLIREVLSDDEEPESSTGSPLGAASSTNDVEPWRADFNAYIDSIEALRPAGMSTIQWWGVSLSRFTISAVENE